MSDRDAYIILNLVPGIGPIKVRELLQCFGSPTAILNEKASSLSKIRGIGDKLASAIAEWQDNREIDEELKRVERAGVRVLTLADAEYPGLLKEIYDPPLCLYLRGHAEVLNNMRMLAVVGSRRTTRYGITVAEKLTMAAVGAGFVVVSGLARGIDTVAHSTTTEYDGITVAVLGSGLGHIYPQENIALAKKICDKGAIISEQPMLAKPDRRSFPIRNRIIAGLSQGTLVVEAGSQSGSLITAQLAVDQGRLVFAVPGRVDSPQSRGCHSLIKSGAKLVESFDDIIDEFELLPGFGGLSRREINLDTVAGREAHPVRLNDSEQQIADLLREGELTVDDIRGHLDLPISTILSILLTLEIKRVVYQLPGKRYGLKNKD